MAWTKVMAIQIDSRSSFDGVEMGEEEESRIKKNSQVSGLSNPVDDDLLREKTREEQDDGGHSHSLMWLMCICAHSPAHS